MKIAALTFSLLLLVLPVVVSPVYGQSFDRPVTSVSTTGEDIYHAGFMEWAQVQHPFLAPVEFAILGEVVSTDLREDETEVGDCAVRIMVHEILLCPHSLVRSASKIRYLVTGNCVGVSPGDFVLVFMVRYEGAFAIPNWCGTNIPIGHKLKDRNSGGYCGKDRIVELIRSGHAWELESLSSEELRLWKCIDSEGLLEALIQAKENVE